MAKIKTQVEENFDFNELKNQINQIKEAKKQAEKDNQGKENKQSFGKKNYWNTCFNWIDSDSGFSYLV